MNHKATSASEPGDRPPGLPGNARFAAGGVIAGLIFVTINGAAAISVCTNNTPDFLTLLGPVFVPLIVCCVAVMWLVNTGKLALIKSFRILALAVTLLYGAGLIADLALVAAYGAERTAPAIMGGAALLLLSPLIILMWRDFRRCRWLDPASLPAEWETAAIHDPGSVNYIPPKPQARKPNKQR